MMMMIIIIIIMTSLKSQLNLGFLDDVSLGGPVNTVAADAVSYTHLTLPTIYSV